MILEGSMLFWPYEILYVFDNGCVLYDLNSLTIKDI